jgi:hypothetical protein
MSLWKNKDRLSGQYLRGDRITNRKQKKVGTLIEKLDLLNQRSRVHKCKLFLEEIDFLGHVITQEGK